jgi:hypothetical protein
MMAPVVPAVIATGAMAPLLVAMAPVPIVIAPLRVAVTPLLPALAPLGMAVVPPIELAELRAMPLVPARPR